MFGSMVLIQSPSAEIRRGKKRRKKETGQKYNVRICYAGGGINSLCPPGYNATILWHKYTMTLHRHMTITEDKVKSHTFSMNDRASLLTLTKSTWSHAKCGPSWHSIGKATSTRSTYVFACFTCGTLDTGRCLFSITFGSPLNLHQLYTNINEWSN